MKLIAALIVLLIVGFLIYTQLGLGTAQKNEAQSISSPGAPKVPTTPGEVKQFGVQMNNYMKAEAAKRAAAMKKAEGR